MNNRYYGFDSEARKSQWRSDRIDKYARYRISMQVDHDVLLERYLNGDDPELILKELLSLMNKSDEELTEKLHELDTDYFALMMEP